MTSLSPPHQHVTGELCSRDSLLGSSGEPQHCYVWICFTWDLWDTISATMNQHSYKVSRGGGKVLPAMSRRIRLLLSKSPHVYSHV